jgi:hypothetical protein
MSGNGWSLEVVRGNEAGRVYTLGRGETVLGNALNGSPGLDLAHQEGSSPRRMAARQAQLDCSPQGLLVRDLESPGGTFVNRQRLLPGQARTLQLGDLIQLGGVQLKVVAGSPPIPPANSPAPAATAAKTPRPSVSAPPKPAAQPPKSAATTARAGPIAPAFAQPSAPVPQSPARPGPLPAVFTLASGARCRTWDDFLTVSAQRWPAMRDELVSGRLAAFFGSIGRGDAAPSAQTPGTPDERLDAWLATLPTTRPSRPELEVHPEALKLRAVPGGGILRASLQVTNTGYRLLRTDVRVEPASASWIKLSGEFARGAVVTVDQTELILDVHIPESFDVPTSAVLVLESNGGTRRVDVRLERPAVSDAIPSGPAAPVGTAGLGLRDLIERQPPGLRLVAWAAGGLLVRLIVVVAGRLLGPGPVGASPALGGVALILAALGCGLAVTFALKRGEPRDAPAVGFAGGVAGILAAAILVAGCRTIEPMMGTSLAGSSVAVCLLWGALGAGLAAASTVLTPYRSAGESTS